MKGQTFTTMDGLRGIAALMVVAYHAPGTQALVPGAYMAVDMFFALSGFVLAHSSMGKLTSLRAGMPFLIKRLVRLCPLYLVGLALGVIAYGYATTVDGNFWPTALVVNLGLNAAFLPVPQAYALNAWSAFPLNNPAWSLSFEMFVNIILGLTAFLYTARRLGVIVGLSALGLVSVALFHGSLDVGSAIPTFPLGFARVMFAFFAGIAIYRAWAAGALTLIVPWWVSIGALFALLCLPIPDTHRAIGDLAIVLLASPLILATSTGTPSLPVLRYFGRISYAVYIIHVPILALLRIGSADILERDFSSFGLAGTVVLLAMVLATAALLDPVDVAVRRWLTSMIAASPWKSFHSDRPTRTTAT